MDKIQSSYTRCGRAILGTQSIGCSNEIVLQNLNWENLNDRVQRLKKNTLHYTIKHNAPHELAAILQRVQHSHHTRFADRGYELNRSRGLLGTKAFSFWGPRLASSGYL